MAEERSKKKQLFEKAFASKWDKGWLDPKGIYRKVKTMSDIRELQNVIHAMAISKGWWADHHDRTGNIRLNPHELAAKLCLIHSEVSEALECVRRGELETFVSEGKPEGLPTEIADVVIRCLDLAGALGIDLAAEIERKRAYNATRRHRHGGKVL